MIKSKAIMKRKVLIAQTYPCLKRCDGTNGDGPFIVLFSADDKGVVVNSDNIERPTGYYTDNWDIKQFFPWYGTVELISKP